MLNALAQREKLPLWWACTYAHYSWFFYGAAFPSGPEPPYYRGFTITHRHTTRVRTPLDEWSAQRTDLYLTTHNTHKRQGILTLNSGKLAAFDQRLRPRGHWDRLSWYIYIYITIILLSVLCGFEIWSATLRDEFSLRVFRRTVRGKISDRKCEEIVENWSEWRNEELVICTPH